MGAALTTTGRAGTARRLGSGKQDGKVYESRNQWSNPLKARTGSNLVDMGRDAAHVRQEARMTPSSMNRVGKEAMRKVCGVPMAMLQGKKLGTSPVERSTVNVGKRRDKPLRCSEGRSRAVKVGEPDHPEPSAVCREC